MYKSYKSPEHWKILEDGCLIGSMCGVLPPSTTINTALEKAAGSGDSMELLFNGSPKNLPLTLILILHVNLQEEDILRSFFRGDERNPFNGRRWKRGNYPACPLTEAMWSSEQSWHWA